MSAKGETFSLINPFFGAARGASKADSCSKKGKRLELESTLRLEQSLESNKVKCEPLS